MSKISNAYDSIANNPVELEEDGDNYEKTLNDTEASVEATSEDTLLIHGLDMDWVEQEMSGDTVFM